MTGRDSKKNHYCKCASLFVGIILFGRAGSFGERPLVFRLFLPNHWETIWKTIWIIFLVEYGWITQSCLKPSVPPIWIYIPSDAQLSPSSLGIFKSVCWYGKFVFILVLSMWSVHQKWRRAMLRATDSRKRCSRAGTIFNSRDPFTYYDWE